jgi:hypothetical protein
MQIEPALDSIPYVPYELAVCVSPEEKHMSMQPMRKSQRMTLDEIVTRTAIGVARALEARQKVGGELSEEECGQVSGGTTSLINITFQTNGYMPPPLE